MLHNILTSTELLADASRSFCDRCAVGIEPNEKRIKEHLDHSLMLVTALNSHIDIRRRILRAFYQDPKDLSPPVNLIQQAKIYPLNNKAAAKPMTFPDASGVPVNMPP